MKLTWEAEQAHGRAGVLSTCQAFCIPLLLKLSKLPQIRNKSSHQRSLEEKQWVALDILINKDSYKALSAVENEELQLNDEYKTELRAEDVNRILGLPREIQLALPHLMSASEVEAHKLLTTYTLEHGEAEFAKADEQSQDGMCVPSGQVRSARCSLRNVLLPPESGQNCFSSFGN